MYEIQTNDHQMPKRNINLILTFEFLCVFRAIGTNKGLRDFL